MCCLKIIRLDYSFCFSILSDYITLRRQRIFPYPITLSIVIIYITSPIGLFIDGNQLVMYQLSISNGICNCYIMITPLRIESGVNYVNNLFRQIIFYQLQFKTEKI